MTIKNRGGVFGRNPTFNDVDVDGTLSVGGAAIPAPANTAKLDTVQTFTANQQFNGKIGIGDTPVTDLHIKTAAPLLRIEDTDGGGAYFQINCNLTHGSTIFQADPTNTAAGSYIRFDVDGSEAARFNTSGNLAFVSGKGIDFSATAGTGTSELFDDYEEGTWTPVIIGGTTAGTGTYSQQDGVYTKVGNLVTVSCYLAFTAHTGTGHMKVSGLPFAGVGSSVDFQAGATQAQYINAGTSATQLAASVVTTASNISLYGFVNNAAKVATQVNASGSGSQLAITLTYRTS